jgi:integrase
MPIRKRGDGWQVDVQAHGKRARCTVSTKAAAVELERKVRDDLEREKYGLRPNRTLEDALEEYLTTTARALKSYESLLYVARVIRPFLSRPLDRISDAASDIIRDGQAQNRAPATVNRHLALLRRLGKLAYQWGWTDKQLGGRVVLLTENNERHLYLTPAQVAQIASHADSEALRDAIWLAATTGLRRGELLALRPENYRDGALWLSTSKSGRPRRVPVPVDARDVCERLPLKITAVALRRGFERARKKAGMEGVHFHDLRHTFASWAIAAGVDLRLLKDLMGHSTMQMTSRYAHLEDRQLTAAIGKMARKRATPARRG